MKALVVDDSLAARFKVSKMVAAAGLEVVEAVNGRDALEKAPPPGELAVALVDWNMPVMNGLDFVTALRTRPEYAGTVVVMVTTETEITQMVKAMEAGANEYLMKPFTAEMLVEKLKMTGVVTAHGE